MFRKFVMIACVGAVSWLGLAESSDAAVRVVARPNRAVVRLNAPVYAPAYGPVVAPGYGYGYGYGYGPAVVNARPVPRRAVVTPNRVRVSGPRGSFRVRF